MVPDPDEEEVEYVRLYDGRERHWKMFFEDNDGWVDNQKMILNNKRWGVYMNKKEVLIKGGCFVKVSGSNRKKVIWIVV